MNEEYASYRRRELKLILYSHIRKLLYYGSMFSFATFGMGFFWFLSGTSYWPASILLIPTAFIWLSSLEDVWKMSCRVAEDCRYLRMFDKATRKL